MNLFYDYTIAFIIALVVTVIATPIVRMIAFKLNIVDLPSENRKIHKKPMPYLGGVAIALGFFAGFIYLHPTVPAESTFSTPAFIAGALIILFTGIIDDKYSLPPKYKFLMQILAAVVIVASGLTIDFIQLPFFERIEFGWLAYPLSVLWIVGITNAINFIDGLDGLASGVSSIALGTMLVMGVLENQLLAVALSVILIGGTIGFLFFNFHPAKIFMGDSGAMFIGYTMAVISITGLFKSLTIFSLILPIIILAIPIFDTSFAIVRRLLKGQKISTADRMHLHHCLMNLGFSHRTTVLIIYGISVVFGVSAIIFARSVLWGSLIILALCIIMLRFTYELLSSWNKRKPLVDAVKKLTVQGQKSKS
ncbi:glycosyltransferase family 4 protein [Camelliibacillus cellulosilyticus]|uniref:Glycosyltransferase family 4 protein n=1 Tax=Camelliibacillus cellulosilyticus TaxID=2174486 RepID=A0ABV9GPF9_9BACL